MTLEPVLPRTVWRIRGVPPDLGRGLNVELVVDTTAEKVVAAIEQAALDAGIVLERIGTEPDVLGQWAEDGMHPA